MCNLAQGLIDETKDKWLQIGEEKGEEKMAQLFSLLMENGQYELMAKATKDKQLRQELYKKYHIS